jgi:hypothetical protein
MSSLSNLVFLEGLPEFLEISSSSVKAFGFAVSKKKIKY